MTWVSPLAPGSQQRNLAGLAGNASASGTASGMVASLPNTIGSPARLMPSPGATLSVVAEDVTVSPRTTPLPAASPIHRSRARSVVWSLDRSAASSSRPLT